MCRDGDVPDPSPIVGEEHQDDQEAAGRRRNREEVSRLAVRRERGAPQRGLACAIVRINERTFVGTIGLPMRRLFQAHHN